MRSLPTPWMPKKVPNRVDTPPPQTGVQTKPSLGFLFINSPTDDGAKKKIKNENKHKNNACAKNKLRRSRETGKHVVGVGLVYVVVS